MTMKFAPPMFRRLLLLVLSLTGLLHTSALAEYIITGNDNKALVVDGKLLIDPKGKQTVSLIDISGRSPELKMTLEIPNSIYGPPTNLAISPLDTIALVAEAVKLDQNATKFVPSDQVHVIDLTVDPPREIDSITVGKQPSGMSIHPSGRMALVANRAETSLSILRIQGKTVRFMGRVGTKDQVTHVVFTPDGRRALATKATSDKVALLEVDGLKITYTGKDLPVGDYPYSADISPDGQIAITANAGNNSRSDGNMDTVSVIDMGADPPRVIDHIAVADCPETVAISPTGKLAVTGNLNGSDASPDAFFHSPHGSISVLGIEGKKVTKLQEIFLGPIAEALAFSPDGKWLFVGSLNHQNVSVLKVEGRKVLDTGKRIPLPGRPGSMRSRSR
jgi:DNA-binding beta-propeller fold protein YncE